MNNLRIIIKLDSWWVATNTNYIMQTFLLVKFKSKRQYKQVLFKNDGCYMSRFNYKKMNAFVNRMRKYVTEIKHVKV